MDQDKWLAAATMGGGRTAFDLAQAKSMMKGPSKKKKETPSGGKQGSSSIMTDDYESGMRGLQRAAHYRKEGNLEKAKKIYVLSIELLMEVYKARKEELGERDTEVSKLIRTIENAVKETEQVQACLSSSSSSAAATGATTTTNNNNNNNNSPSSLASFRQNSFDEIATSLQSAVGRIASSNKKKKTTTNTTRKKTSVVASPKNTTTTPPPQQQLPTTAADELTNTVLADFYVPPSRMEPTQWDDIAGLATVKQSLQEVAILPLIRPDLFTGLRRTQNILLYGPPGTGKTMLVRAVAVESQSHLFVCSAAVVTSKWLGEAEKMVRRLFQIAHEIAPAIIFIDEIDALLSSRKSSDGAGGGGEHEASRRLKTEFMVQMDGLTTQTTTTGTTTTAGGGGSQVLIVGCTNTPWDVDSAVLRRLQRRIFVPLPDDAAREALIRHLLNRAGKHSITSSRQIATLVKRTHGFSCSDISAMAAEASFGPLRELGGLSAMKNVSASAVRPVQLRDFETVLDGATKSVNETQLRKYDQWQSDQAAT